MAKAPTPDPIEAVRPVYEQLRKIRESKETTLKPCVYLRDEIVGLDGETQPMKLRYYQSQGIFHLVMMPRMVLGDGTGLGKCVTGGSLLVSDKGILQIRSLCPKALDPKTAKEGFYRLDTPVSVWNGTKMTPVRSFYWGGLKPTQRVTTSFGYQIEGTLNHPIMIRTTKGHEFKKLSDVKIGDYVVINHHAQVPFPAPNSEELPITVGAKVPQEVLQGSKKLITWYLQSIVDAGAICTSEGVRLAVSSRRFGKELQLLFLRLGIFVKREFQYGPDDKLVCSLTFSSMDALYYSEHVGFGPRFTQQSLQPIYNSPNLTDYVPLAFPLLRRLKQTVLRHLRRIRDGSAVMPPEGWDFRVFGCSLKDILGRIKPDMPLEVPYAVLAEMCHVFTILDITGKVFTELGALLSSRPFYDRIKKVETDVSQVMDIEVRGHAHTFVANGIINHNTIEAIGGICYNWLKEPQGRVMIVTPKSALTQWASEIKRFTKGIRPVIATGTLEQRQKAYEEFFNAPAESDKMRTVLLVNYHILCRDWKQGQFKPLLPNGHPDPKQTVVPGLLDKLTQDTGANLTIIFDEASAFKSTRTQVWEICSFLSVRARRVYGLTATMLKNRLDEGYAIFKVIHPAVFGTKTSFLDTYCVTKMQPVGGGRKIPIVIGYKNLDLFRARIDPFFLGRTKHMVSTELPVLTTREITCELSPPEIAKYNEALSGVFELGDGEVKDYEEHKAFVSLIYCQQVVNSLHMLRFKEGDEIQEDFDSVIKLTGTSSKEQALLDLITEQLDGEKVIVYTRFESLVSRLQELLAKEKIKSVRITGKENDKERKKSQDAFQNLKNDTNVIFITAAGSEAINLQAASAMVFFDAPWSWGDYLQVIGRMIRIGSPHKGVLVYHLLASLPGDTSAARATIDTHVLSMLRRKKNMIDKVIGEAAVGALTFEKADKGGAVQSLIKKLKNKE